MKRSVVPAVIGLALLTVLPRPVEARVVRFIVESTRRVAAGRTFGDVGPYERLDGTAYIEVDPKDPLNAVIVNLDKAPKTSAGMVGFSTPFFVLKPIDMARGNGKILYGVNNRGNKLDYSWRVLPQRTGLNNSNDPLVAEDFGDAFLSRLGYTYVDAGWQGNVAPGNGRLVPDFPIATELDGRPVVARIRVEYTDADGFTRPLEGGSGFRAYEPSTTDTAQAALTVRDHVGGSRTALASNRWAFGRCQQGPASLVPTKADICLFDGFKPDRIYELIYAAKNPIVMGLAYVVTRDVASFLRYQTHDDAGNANPLALGPTDAGIRRVYGSGISSSGMHLRDFLYLGFNEDESHRKVFDALQIVIPGTHRLLANVEFSDPNTYSRQDVWHDSLSYSYPPLTFAMATDPISGIRDGILKRPSTDPLVFQVDSANEFWQMSASLNVHDGHGEPVRTPDNVRLYFASSFQHVGVAGLLSPAGAAGLCEVQTQGNGWAPTLRALLAALDDWADRGVPPPPSNYPTLQGKTLVSLGEARAAFPKIPGVRFPAAMNELAVPGFGPGFGATGGRLVQLPPTLGARYAGFVPKADADGLDVAGIRSVEVAAPTATLTGWNVRRAGRRETDLCGLSGMMVPFAKTREERQRAGDPRPSLEERYGDHGGFVRAVEDAAGKLVTDRFLLREDAERYVQAARESEILKSAK